MATALLVNKWVVAVLALAGVAAAQNKYLNVGTGTPTGTYAAIFKDMGKVCANAAYLKERGTAGTIENIDLLLNNEVSLAFLQLDALQAKKTIENDTKVDQVKTLIPLYPEEIHIVVRADLADKPAGVFGSFKKPTIITKFSQLKGKRVGAWGGSIITSKLVSSYTRTAFDLKTYSGRTAQETALNDLKNGSIDAILAVGGYPVKWIKDLEQGRYRMLNFDQLPTLTTKLYTPTKVSYVNLSADAVQTFSVLSVLATKDFKTIDKAKMLMNYKKCVTSKIVTMQEEEGYHPKWNAIDPQASVAWPMYAPKLK